MQRLSIALGALLIAPAVLAVDATTVLRKTSEDHHFQITVTPEKPRPGHRVKVVLDVNKITKVPDPTYGDRVPIRNASLIAVVHPEGDPTSTRRYAMHPMGGAGLYGFHWTPTSPMLHVLRFERRGEKLPQVSFLVGVGVDTPEQEMEEKPKDEFSFSIGSGGGLGLRRGPRRPTGTVTGPLTPHGAGPSARSVMEKMADPAGILAENFEKHRPLRSTLSEAAAQLAAQAKGLEGTVPDKYRVAAAEYDGMANDLSVELDALAASIEAGKIGKAKKQWSHIVDTNCSQCHVKFWWALTPDLETWPRIEAKAWKR